MKETKTIHVLSPHPLNELAKKAFEIALSTGKMNPLLTFGEALTHIHSEVSEVYEERREGHGYEETYYGCAAIGSWAAEDCDLGCSGCENAVPMGIPIELADVLIRTLSLCHEYEIDIDAAVKLKMEYNATRHDD